MKLYLVNGISYVRKDTNGKRFILWYSGVQFRDTIFIDRRTRPYLLPFVIFHEFLHWVDTNITPYAIKKVTLKLWPFFEKISGIICRKCVYDRQAREDFAEDLEHLTTAELGYLYFKK